jgi:uncharacterized membrane protein YczE
MVGMDPLGGDAPVRRLVQLYAGLALYGFSEGLMVLSGLGLPPWAVLHQGLAERTGFSIGACAIVVGALVLLLWIPLRQRPGLGTLSNVVLIGVGIDLTLALVPAPGSTAARVAVLGCGVVLNGMATGLYVGARLGPGPRDGLMTGIARRGHRISRVRTGIEVAVLATGFVLGGTVGAGTALYAVGIGPLVHVFLPRLTVPPVPPAPPAPVPVPMPAAAGGSAARA